VPASLRQRSSTRRVAVFWGPRGQGSGSGVPVVAASTVRRIMVEETTPWQKPVTFLDDPPVTPSKGDRHKVGTGTGVWAGHDTEIVWYDGAGWVFDVPQDGWFVFNTGDSTLYVFDGAAWGTVY